MLGFVKTVTGSLNNGLFVVSALVVVGALITLGSAGRPVR
jgi:hypothetical protein